MKTQPILFLIALCLVNISMVEAKNYYVHVTQGYDTNTGTQALPLKTIKKAIYLTLPGDTVTIVKVNFPIHELINIHNKSGEAGKPITVDGQGNVFTGAEKLIPAEWKEVRPGVYRNANLLPDLKAGAPTTQATMMRYFMLWNGKLNRMGRSCDGDLAPFKDTVALKPGEWTYIDAQTAFYVAIKSGSKLEDHHIQIPMRQNGVSFSGTCEYWIIRNVNVKHVINDGFNLHGSIKNVHFEHITATECGDDGISAHEDCSLSISDFVSRRNSTGLCHGEYNVTCVADKLVLEENYGWNLLLGTGTHTFTNCNISAVVPPGGKGGISLLNRPVAGSPDRLTVTFKNCNFPFEGKPASKEKPASFILGEDVRFNISKDSRVGGKISYLPAKK